MPTPRETKLIVEGQMVILSEYYAENQDKAIVPSGKFYQRCKKRNVLSFAIIHDAIAMDSKEWATFYGGGKYKPFVYRGTLYKECIGIEFRSLAAFLMTVG